MCDQDQLAGMGRNSINRRQFAKMGALGTLAAITPFHMASAQAGLRQGTVEFDAPGGKLDAFFVAPAEGKHPAIIVWPDIAGLRDSFISMGRRLAGEGFAVLVVNPFYRDLPAPQFEDFEDFRENGGFQKVGPWRAKLTAPAITETAQAIVAWLDTQDQVDTAKGIGNEGYCMGGPFTVWTAAAVPDRVKAAASFHGGGLVGDADTSPIKLLGQTQASYLIAISKDDDEKAPTEKGALKEAAAAAGRPAEIEVYPGNHGWTVADSPVFDADAAEKAWERKIALYKAAL